MSYEQLDQVTRELNDQDDLKSGGAREDNFTTAIESRTAQVPSVGYLGAAMGAMAVSAVLNLSGKKHWSLFVGQWAAPFLLMGIYNKMVKQHGTDARSKDGLSLAEISAH